MTKDHLALGELHRSLFIIRIDVGNRKRMSFGCTDFSDENLPRQ